ncbi:FGGY family carbohydrate kinase [Pseudogracilibacillus sp. SE30717A]|uniref:xylulokinase n=1 Tax=Pseudogracilibacillus sp. SE30717A TaxID=3098293 RepID=UPI00300E0BC7
MKSSYIVSFDCGTSAVKATLVNFLGEICSVSTESYPLINPKAGWAEQNPEDYWGAVSISAKKAIEHLGIQKEQVRGIVFGTQWKGIIPLDENDNILYNNIIWLDGRAKDQAQKLNKLLNTNVMHQQEYWPRLMWVKENLPEIYRKTDKFLEVNSYLKFKATGVKAVDLTNNFIHAAKEGLQTYYNEIVKAAELDLNKFPPLVLPTEKVGDLTIEAAEQLGLLAGTPVFGGCGDIPAVAIGAGCSGMGSNHIYLGSSGWFSTLTKERNNREGELYQSFDKDKELTIHAIQSAGLTYDWGIEQFYKLEQEKYGDEIYNYITQDIKEIPPGSLNLIATPWIHGELSPLSKNAKAVFLNITSQHDRRHFMTAIMEGICYMLRWKIEKYTYESGHKIDSIRVVGGGASSDIWMQMMANILKIPVQVPNNPRHAGSIGTAYCALIGLGVCQNFDDSMERIKIDKIFNFNRLYEKRYDKLFNVFKNIYPALEDIYFTLNDEEVLDK